jgi:hypothetical protein
LFEYIDNIRVKLNFREFLWLKVIQTLRQLGVSIDLILNVKELLEEKLDNKLLLSVYKEEIRTNFLEEFKKRNYTAEDLKTLESIFDKYGVKHLLNLLNFDSNNMLSLLIFLLISTGVDVGIIILEDGSVFPWTDILKLDEHFSELWISPHISIPFSYYLKEFLNDDKFQDHLVPYGILSEDELKILRFLRSGTFKEITIIYNNKQKPEIIKVTQIENNKERIIDLLRKHNYQKIIITQIDGKVVNVKVKKTFKLK